MSLPPDLLLLLPTPIAAQLARAQGSLGAGLWQELVHRELGWLDRRDAVFQCAKAIVAVWPPIARILPVRVSGGELKRARPSRMLPGEITVGQTDCSRVDGAALWFNLFGPIVVSPDGMLIAATDLDQHLHVLRIAPIRSILSRNHVHTAYEFVTDAVMVFAQETGEVTLLNVLSNTVVAQWDLKQHVHAVVATRRAVVAWTPAGILFMDWTGQVLHTVPTTEFIRGLALADTTVCMRCYGTMLRFTEDGAPLPGVIKAYSTDFIAVGSGLAAYKRGMVLVFYRLDTGAVVRRAPTQNVWAGNFAGRYFYFYANNTDSAYRRLLVE